MVLLSPATTGSAAFAARAAVNRSHALIISSASPLDAIKSTRSPPLTLAPPSHLPRPRPSRTASAAAISLSRTSKWKVSCEVALKSDSQPSSSSAENDSPSVSASGEDHSHGVSARIGARVRVTVPLKVYHVPRVPEVDLTGMEGELKQYVAVFKGKRISANLPFKVEFVKDIEGRGRVKFFAHLKEDEFEYV